MTDTDSVTAPAVSEPAQPAAAEGANTPETALNTPETVTEKDESGEYASRFAKLARKEKALAEERKRIKDQEAQLKALDDLNKLMGSAKDSPQARLELIKKAGLTVDDIIRAALEDQPQEEDPATKALKEVEKLKREREEEQERQRQAEQEKAVATIQQHWNDYVEGISGYIKSDPEKYAAILAEEDGLEIVETVVYQIAEKTLEETGKARILSFNEAADQVEALLREEISKSAQRYQSLPWLQQSSPADQTKTPSTDARDKPKPSPTLTNRTTGVPTVTPTEELTPEERYKRAAALIKQAARNSLR